jgi:hypothetical protein
MILTEQEWEATYLPDQQGYETYGKDLEFIIQVPTKHVWTLVDGDNGGLYIVNGRVLINRILYYVTQEPHNPNDSIEVCVRADQCAVDEHEWEEYRSPDSAQVVEWCKKCDIDKDELEEDSE